MTNNTSRTALITGMTGQDGSYLAELLLTKGYEVHGTGRRSTTLQGTYLEGSAGPRLHLHYIDNNDPLGIVRLLDRVQPAEVYNLSGQSSVGLSFEQPSE